MVEITIGVKTAERTTLFTMVCSDKKMANSKAKAVCKGIRINT